MTNRLVHPALPLLRIGDVGLPGNTRATRAWQPPMPFDSPIAATPVILVVEDTADLCSCVSEYFRLAGFDVVATSNAQDALVAIDSGIHIDLVFTDVNMPGAMDGVGLAHWLSVNRPGLPIILTSGESRPELNRRTPGRRFVRKPYMLDVLEQDIRELIEIFPMQLRAARAR
jgi:DNA-binding NtrC family response regulator